MSKRPQESDVEFIRALAEMLRENDLTEIEVSRDYARGRRAQRPGRAPVRRRARARPVRAPPRPPRSPPRPSAAAPRPAALEDPAEDPGTVDSPMVGTAYLPAEPGAAPFVKVGDKVERGPDLADHRGDEDHEPDPRARAPARSGASWSRTAQPVEYGEPLIVIE